ncbi:MAG: HAD family hydrolase [Gammaproteobacteria bacterium]|nr:HAD family hydrolase [Gammaproteobacteria bacterium]
MPYCDQYEIIIFDCDGVILDSNTMKLSAMRDTLKHSDFPDPLINTAIIAFKNNFGKSRAFHVHYFVEILLKMTGEQSQILQDNILNHYTQAVEEAYLHVPLCEGFLHFLTHLKKQTLYIASGSEQEQLIRIFKKRKLGDHFKGIFGSPESKTNNVRHIINAYDPKKVLFIGDAVADFEAAHHNNIDFTFYAPYSNVKETMLALAKTHHFDVIHSYQK